MAVLSVLIVMPLVLGIGVFLLIPAALLLLPVLAIAGIAALPAAFAAVSRTASPVIAEPAPAVVVVAG